MKHDKERFEKYLEDVKAGKTTIAAGNLLAHQFVESCFVGGVVQELQWKRMVDDLLKKGKMRNCLAVCDVSCSMPGN
ncbi:plant/T31B5-30 protein, partial [Trifolium medium]|nr:plant/T31B5-30 protein [Trifolium medium]